MGCSFGPQPRITSLTDVRLVDIRHGTEDAMTEPPRLLVESPHGLRAGLIARLTSGFIQRRRGFRGNHSVRHVCRFLLEVFSQISWTPC